MWYCVALTGGATDGKHNKRTVARQHHTARGQSDKLKGDERAPWVHGTASRGLGEKLHGRAEGDLRKVPRLLERVRKSIGSSHIRVRLSPRHANRD